MIKKLSLIFAVLTSLFMFTLPLLPVTVFADPPTCDVPLTDPPTPAGCTPPQTTIFDPNATKIPQAAADQGHLQAIINIVFGVLGSVAVLIITIAGFRFVIHQGNPQDTAKARNSIVYAVVGLIVALSAWVAVSFVLGKL